MSSPGQEGGHGPILVEEETEKQGEEVASMLVCLSIYRHSQAATCQQARDKLASGRLQDRGQGGKGADSCRGNRWRRAAPQWGQLLLSCGCSSVL